MTLPFRSFTFSPGSEQISFADDDGVAWSCTLSDYVCTRGAAADGAGGRGRGQGPGGGGRGRGGPGSNEPTTSVSPDKRLTAFIRDHNVHVRDSAAAADAGEKLTDGGTADHPFTAGGLVWSPDSRKIAASRIIERGDRRMVRYVDSSPADQLQPKTFERFYAKPGDALDRQERC